MSNAATFGYDAADRLFRTVGSSATRFLYSGDQIIGEYDDSGAVLHRYAPGAARDEVAAQYDGSGYGTRKYLMTDRQGSVTSVLNDAGSLLSVNTYDESGIPASGNVGRFQFNGAAYIPEADLHYMRARMYSHQLGRFMQTDPIGYGDGLNWYSYVHGDPVNGWDPDGESLKIPKWIQDLGGGVASFLGGIANSVGSFFGFGGSENFVGNGVYNADGSPTEYPEVTITAKVKGPTPSIPSASVTPSALASPSTLVWSTPDMLYSSTEPMIWNRAQHPVVAVGIELGSGPINPLAAQRPG